MYFICCLFSFRMWFGLALHQFLHLPIGIWYISSVESQNLVSARDWIIGSIYFIASVYLFIVKGNMWLKNLHSPYKFTRKQLGRYHRS